MSARNSEFPRYSGPDVRWAVLGTSEFALDWVVPAVVRAEGAALTAVVTRNPEQLLSNWSPPVDVAVLPDLEQAAQMGVEVVHLIAPNDVHESLTLQATALGMHVVVEKPAAATIAALQRMEEAAAAAGVLLTVGSCMAWAPPVVAAVSAVQDGEIGIPLYATIAVGFDSPPDGQWRQSSLTADGGGPLFDLGSHAVDALLRIVGTDVVRVDAVLDHRRYHYAAHDSASLQLQFASGVHAAAHFSFAGGLNTLTVHGTTGSLHSTEWLGRRLTGNLRLSRSSGAADFDRDTKVSDHTIGLREVDVLQAQAEELSAALRGGPPPRTAVQPYGRKTTEILEAAVRSANSGAGVEVEVEVAR